MEDFVRKAMLFDCYGELLNEHQRRIYSAVVFEDIGYSETAIQEGISRQGVHDLIRRCDRQLEKYEEKLHVLEKLVTARDIIRQLRLDIKDGSLREADSRANELEKLLLY